MLTNSYEPKYFIGYRYRIQDTEYEIVDIVKGSYHERSSALVGVFCIRCDVFDANHGIDGSISMGLGLEPHPESRKVDESSRTI